MLDEIVKKRRAVIATCPEIGSVPLCTKNFLDIFHKNFAIIAELKSRSPSEGVIAESYDPVRIAEIYAMGGASAISVLTEPDYFGGSFLHLANVEAAVEIPLLCKDFIVAKKQIRMARACGASACLLIVAALSDAELRELKQEIESLQMTAVVEVFNEKEIARALALNPSVIQINHRNLKDLTVDLQTSHELCDLIPQPIKIIAASGLKQPTDILSYAKRVDGVLVGTALMKSTAKVTFLETLRKLRK